MSSIRVLLRTQTNLMRSLFACVISHLCLLSSRSRPAEVLVSTDLYVPAQVSHVAFFQMAVYLDRPYLG